MGEGPESAGQVGIAADCLDHRASAARLDAEDIAILGMRVDRTQVGEIADTLGFPYRTEDWQLLLTVAKVVRGQVEQQTTEAVDWGFCHGDLTLDNVHIDGDTITVFDFDYAAEHWRAWEPHGVAFSPVAMYSLPSVPKCSAPPLWLVALERLGRSTRSA